jgi:hypothetical protein
MFSITINVPRRELARLIARLPEAEKAGLARVVSVAQQIALRQVGKIYARRIPRSGAGRALWERTGNLMRAVQGRPLWEGSGAVRLEADTPYAMRRHELGVSWMPSKPALGIVRRNPFFADTAKIIEPQVADLFADGFNSVWEA